MIGYMHQSGIPLPPGMAAACAAAAALPTLQSQFGSSDGQSPSSVTIKRHNLMNGSSNVSECRNSPESSSSEGGGGRLSEGPGRVTILSPSSPSPPH